MSSISSRASALRPKKLETWASIVAVTVLLFIACLPTIMNTATTGAAPLTSVPGAISSPSELITNMFGQFRLGGSIAIILFWMLIGAVVFFIGQFIVASMAQFKTDFKLASKKYMHPETFRRSTYRRNMLTDIFGFLLGIGFLTVLAAVIMFFIFPHTLQSVKVLVTAQRLDTAVIAVVSYITLILSIWLWIYLLKLLSHRKVVFGT